jgi:hypothetical protein
LGWGSLGNRTKDNLNLNFVQVAVTKFNNLVKALLPDVRLGLSKSQVVPLDYGAADRPFPQPIALDTFLQRHVKKEDHRRNLKPLRQFQKLPTVRRSERGGIHHAEPVQSHSQFREVADKRERLRVESLVALVVTDPASRPVRRDDLRGTKVALCKS